MGAESINTEGSIGTKELEEFFQDVKANKRTFKDLDEVSIEMKRFSNKLRLSERQVQLKDAANTDPQQTYWNRARHRFLQEYKSSGRHDYEQLSTSVRSECAGLLKMLGSMESEPILYQDPSSRTKDFDSLKDKLRKQASKLRKVGPVRDVNEALDKLSERVLDLSGIRILVYFPDDVPRVVQAIKDSSNLVVMPNAVVVSYSRNRIDHREKDRSSQAKSSDIGYKDGAFAEIALSKDDIPKRWKNSGYRAVHIHVQKKAKEPTVNRQNVPQVKHKHNKVRVNETQELVRSKASMERDTSGIDWTFQTNKVAEIQITTVVMHVWSQVEHDIIYKNPQRLLINNTIMRMLDGINGLAINSELMLEELRRGVNEAHVAAKSRDSPKFRDQQDRGMLERILEREYLKDNDDWNADPFLVKVLCDITCSVNSPNASSSVPNPGDYISTPGQLRPFVDNVLRGQPECPFPQDLALAVLKELGRQFKQDCLLTYDFGIHVDSKAPSHLLASLYELFLAANTFSVFVVLEGLQAIEALKTKFPDAAKKLSLINALVLGVEVPGDANTIPRLVAFARDFSTASLGPKHSLAVALSSLWFCMGNYVMLGDLHTGRNEREADMIRRVEKGTAPYDELLSCFGPLRCVVAAVVFDFGPTSGRTLWKNASEFSADYDYDVSLAVISWQEIATLSPLTKNSLKHLEDEDICRQLRLMYRTSSKWQS